MSIINKYISGIFKKPDCGKLLECADGTFTNTQGKGACSKHGGLKGKKTRQNATTKKTKKISSANWYLFNDKQIVDWYYSVYADILKRQNKDPFEYRLGPEVDINRQKKFVQLRIVVQTSKWEKNIFATFDPIKKTNLFTVDQNFYEVKGKDFVEDDYIADFGTFKNLQSAYINALDINAKPVKIEWMGSGLDPRKKETASLSEKIEFYKKYATKPTASKIKLGPKKSILEKGRTMFLNKMNNEQLSALKKVDNKVLVKDIPNVNTLVFMPSDLVNPESTQLSDVKGTISDMITYYFWAQFLDFEERKTATEDEYYSFYASDFGANLLNLIQGAKYDTWRDVDQDDFMFNYDYLSYDSLDQLKDSLATIFDQVDFKITFEGRYIGKDGNNLMFKNPKLLSYSTSFTNGNVTKNRIGWKDEFRFLNDIFSFMIRDIAVSIDPKLKDYLPKESILYRINGIGEIFKSDNCGPFYECKDGTYTLSNGKGACSRHGGLKKKEKKEKLVVEKLKLINKGLRTTAGTKKQKEIIKDIKKIDAELKKTVSKKDPILKQIEYWKNTYGKGIGVDRVISYLEVKKDGFDDESTKQRLLSNIQQDLALLKNRLKTGTYKTENVLKKVRSIIPDLDKFLSNEGWGQTFDKSKYTGFDQPVKVETNFLPDAKRKNGRYTIAELQKALFSPVFPISEKDKQPETFKLIDSDIRTANQNFIDLIKHKTKIYRAASCYDGSISPMRMISNNNLWPITLKKDKYYFENKDYDLLPENRQFQDWTKDNLTKLFLSEFWKKVPEIYSILNDSAKFARINSFRNFVSFAPEIKSRYKEHYFQLARCLFNIDLPALVKYDYKKFGEILSKKFGIYYNSGHSLAAQAKYIYSPIFNGKISIQDYAKTAKEYAPMVYNFLIETKVIDGTPLIDTKKKVVKGKAPEIHTITEDQFIKGVFDGIYDFKTLGQNKTPIQSFVQAYNRSLATNDQQNIKIVQDDILRRLKGRHKGFVLQAYKDGKTIPESVLSEYPDIKRAYDRKTSSETKKQPKTEKKEPVKKTVAPENSFSEILQLLNNVRGFKYQNISDVYSAFDRAYSLKSDAEKILNTKKYPKKLIISILAQINYMAAIREKNEKKGYIADTLIKEIALDFLPNKTRTFNISLGGKRFDYWEYAKENIKKEWTQETYDKARKLADEKRKAKEKSLENPETLKDFELVARKRDLTDDEKKTVAKLQEKELIEKAERLRENVKKEKERALQMAKRAQSVTTNVAFTITDFTHTKTGEQFKAVTPNERTSTKDEWYQLVARAKKLGGYYNRYAKAFLFKDSDAAFKFADIKKDIVNTNIELEKKNFEKFREYASKLENTANEELTSDRKANTARRARFAASAQQQAYNDLKLAAIYRTIADLQENEKLKFLDWLSFKTDIDYLLSSMNRAKMNYSRSVYGNDWYSKYKNEIYPMKFDFKFKKHIESGLYLQKWVVEDLIRVLKDTKGFKQFANQIKKLINKNDEIIEIPQYYWSKLNDAIKKLNKTSYYDAFVGRTKDALLAAYRLKRLGLEDQDLLYAALLELQKVMDLSKDNKKKIAVKTDLELARLRRENKGEFDYFYTSDQIADKMARLAQITNNDVILEPSAGDGSIARAIKRENPNAKLDVIEINYDFKKYLTNQGFNLLDDDDFLQFSTDNKYNKILMNPPFSKRQDAKHVIKAFEHLKPNGILVAIIGAGTWGASDQPSKALQQLYSEHGIYNEILENQFKEAGTGARAVLLVLKK